jgi:hypothetical protein
LLKTIKNLNVEYMPLQPQSKWEMLVSKQ